MDDRFQFCVGPELAWAAWCWVSEMDYGRRRRDGGFGERAEDHDARVYRPWSISGDAAGGPALSREVALEKRPLLLSVEVLLARDKCIRVGRLSAAYESGAEGRSPAGGGGEDG